MANKFTNHIQVFLPRSKTFKVLGGTNFKYSSLISIENVPLFIDDHELSYSRLTDNDFHVWDCHINRYPLCWTAGQKYQRSLRNYRKSLNLSFKTSLEDLNDGILEYHIDDFTVKFFDTIEKLTKN